MKTINLKHMPDYLRVLGFVYENPNIIVMVISNKLQITYSHVSKLVSELANAKLITFEYTGRVKRTNLTDKGKQVGEAVVYLMQALEE
jgi:Mn-dependent DtxR family transcriptional regulator